MGYYVFGDKCGISGYYMWGDRCEFVGYFVWGELFFCRVLCVGREVWRSKVLFGGDRYVFVGYCV